MIPYLLHHWLLALLAILGGLLAGLLIAVIRAGRIPGETEKDRIRRELQKHKDWGNY